jgi:hypothetical protein
MTELDRLLETLDPARTLDVASARADEALNSLPMPKAITATWNDFQDLMTRFSLHVRKAILRLNPHYEGNAESDWFTCREALKKEYGASGFKAAFEVVRTGGVYKVLKVVAHNVAEEYGAQEVAARAHLFLNRLSAEERIATAREYLRKYGHLLPSELTEGGAARIVENFAQVLKEHPRLIRKLRRVGR